MENKEHYKIEDIEKTTTKVNFIICPSCGELYEGLFGIEKNFYIRDAQNNNWEINLDRLNENEINERLFYCSECGFIFDKESKNWESKEIKVTAYICPKCNEIISKTPSNFSYDGVGYMCPKCNIFLAYYKPQHHGSGNIEVRKTTDYFHGICPNCKKEEEHGRMYLRGEIIIGDNSLGVKGKLILPLKCQKCGYEDTIKIATSNHSSIKLEFE